MTKYALIDADIILHISLRETQEMAIDWDINSGKYFGKHSLQTAITIFKRIVAEWIEVTNLSRYILVCSPEDGSNFRKKLYPRYKAHRPPKPDGYFQLFTEVKKLYKLQIRNNLEADDVLGILSTSPTMRESVIVSTDKDMKTLPSLILNPYSNLERQQINLKDADRMWRYQTLIGDKADGYPGLPKVGPKKAKQILDNDDTWDSVFNAYKKYGYTESDAILQARLARILRYEDFKKDNGGQIRLWNPFENEIWIHI